MKLSKLVIFIATFALLAGLFFILKVSLSTSPQASNEPKLIRIAIVDGQPTGGIRNVTVAQDQTVRLEVESNVADDLHVHGYDHTVQLEPNQTKSLTFNASLAGTFSAELHGSDAQVLELTVLPK